MRRRSALIAVALICLGSVFAFAARHRLRDVAKNMYHSARDRYHEYKDAQFRKQFDVIAKPERAEAPLIIYKNGLQNGFADWSWATRNFKNPAATDNGSIGISMTADDYKGLYFAHGSFGVDGYGSFDFMFRGTKLLTVSDVDAGGKFGTHISIADYIKGDPDSHGFLHASVPLTVLGIKKPLSSVTGFAIQADKGAHGARVDIDDVALMPDMSIAPPPQDVTVAVTITVGAAEHPISPYIYGVAFAPTDYLKSLNLRVNRWGGNDKSRYNWQQGNARNAARDYRWMNGPVDNTIVKNAPSSAADKFVAANKLAGASTLLTVPTLGWVAKDTDNSHASQNVPGAGGTAIPGTDGAIAGYDPAANRNITSVRSEARRPASGAQPGVVYEDDWIRHLKASFGPASAGGVTFYAMDNEPDLWDYTHTDVHPARAGFDDVLAEFLDYSNAVKDVDPTAQVTGPVSWGWTGFEYSALDRGDDNFHSHKDSDAHGDMWFLPWFLKKVHEHDVKTGRRSLDVLDVHYYPQGQGIYGSAADPDTTRRRLRATRSLWDPSYPDESWIGKPIDLIPRLQSWVAKYYPGTKIGLTEWNFGADGDIGGGLAIADVLGDFGREGLYLGNYWAYPAKDSPGYLAFKLYRNADGANHGFGDISESCVSSSPADVAAYAAKDSKTGLLTVMLVNQTTRAVAHVPLVIHGISGTARIADAWRLDASKPSTLQRDTREIGLRPGSVTLSPRSVTLYRIATRGSSHD